MTYPRLVLVHGRSQQGRDPAELRRIWIDALKVGLGPDRSGMLDEVDVVLPFYGDLLEHYAQQMDDVIPADVLVRGSSTEGEASYLRFEVEYLTEVADRLGIDATQIAIGDVAERGALNWAWVQALLRAADAIPGVSATTLERFTRDVHLYLSRSRVRDEVNAIVAGAVPQSRSVVIAHSLGSVVAYDVLRNATASHDVALYVTVGCPLGVGPIARTFAPKTFPSRTGGWFNAYDRRDVVSLNPLDDRHFAVDPPVQNHGDVVNGTDNAHGIVGYLSDRVVADRVAQALGM